MKRLPLATTCLILITLFLTATGLPEAAAGIQSENLPPALAPWQSWVLYGHKEELCAIQYNDSSVLRCRWPTYLKLEVSAEGGRFEQSWLMLSRGWVALPGSPELWPDAISIDGRSAAAIQRENEPSVELLPGEHHIEGHFLWNRMPEMIQVPPQLGLLSLKVEGRTVEFPLVDSSGRLWLNKDDTIAESEERLEVQVFRLLNDTIPMQVTTVVNLDVSGKNREIELPEILPVNAVPMAMSGSLPARIDTRGHLFVQVRPGRWSIHITARLTGPVHKVHAGQGPYGDEIWSFQPQHQLRMVQIEGVPPVEPSQTDMPETWHRWPAYLVKPESAMVFKETRRGDPDPAPDQLSLQRTYWLDFDGRGLTVHDQISGTLSRSWSLSMNPPMELGRVAVDGQNRVITRRAADGGCGVELRRGSLLMEADARLPVVSGRLAALGWDLDFQQVRAVLHLPPGWSLLSATGMDRVSQTWLQRWTLLDFFLVLIIALAVAKLRSWPWGLLALATMALIFHEPGAPRLVWLHILAVIALLPLLPAGWIKRAVSLWGLAAVVVLLVSTIPFIVHQLRWGVFPQLAPVQPVQTFGGFETTLDGRLAMKPSAVAPEPPQVYKEKAARERALYRSRTDSMTSQQEPSEKAYWQTDPDALIPTGPGLPDWQWRSAHLLWNGPVAKEQTLRIILIPPWANLLLALLRAGLLAALIWGIVDWRKIRHQIPWPTHPATVGLVMAGLLIASGTNSVKAAEQAHGNLSKAAPAEHVRLAAAGQAADGFPTPELLEELKRRLLEKPDCLPYCADISRLELAAVGEELQLKLKIHSAVDTAVPLPVNHKSWIPGQILLDNAPISGLSRDENGQLWALIPEGLHTLVLVGRAGHRSELQIPLPLKPHTAAFSVGGWDLKGIQPDGSVGSSILLTRLQKEGGKSAGEHLGDHLPVFLSVERMLRLGLTWQVQTTIRRITPIGTPVVISVPLLADESVVTAGLPVDQGHVLINMRADQQTIQFASTLKISDQIHLTAARAVPWSETWILDAGPIWHCEFSGIPVVHHQDRSGQWQPNWQPWPGESVDIRISRPPAVSGQLVTIDHADLSLTPGRRYSQGRLSMQIRSSRGGQHTVELPPMSNLQRVAVNSKSLPVRQDNQLVTVPLQPGAQTVEITWHQLSAFDMLYQSPPVKIGGQAVNARVTFNMPPNRWILLAGGPRWGPAVLFWSYLAVIVLAAVALGRTHLAPLKTWQWFLLGLGLTQVPAQMALIIVGWLLVLGLRGRLKMPGHWLPYNGIQAGLLVWTLTALACMFFAVQSGLLGQPEMQIAGNHSSYLTLHWTQDRIDQGMPRPWVFSLPVWVFRALMLAWSLWLALSLLHWLKWGWYRFAQGGLWRKVALRRAGARMG